MPLGDSPYAQFRRLAQAVTGVVELAQGTDLTWPRHSAQVVGGLGFDDLGISVAMVPNGQGGPADELWRVTIAQVGPLAVEHGLISDAEIHMGLAELADPAFADIGFGLISVKGRRPGINSASTY